MKDNKTVIVCVCSEQYLPQYRVLYSSIQKFCPNFTSLLYYTGHDTLQNVGEVVNISHWYSKYTGKDEFHRHCSYKPRAVLDAFNRGYERVLLLGADTEFFDTPKEIDVLDSHDAFVTMYIHEPYPSAPGHIYGNDYQVFINGQINYDMVGFKKTNQILVYLTWLADKAENYAVMDNIVMIDQGWGSMIFSFVDNVKVLRHPGYNVAHYNMFQRKMFNDNGKWLVYDKQGNKHPLVLFHFAGFQKGKEHNISRHQNRYKAEGEILDFLKDYGNKL